MPASSETLALALRHHQAGTLVEAGRLYRQILEAEPAHADALHLLGVLANQLGDPALAVHLIGRAVAINPAADAYHNNLANAFKASGNFTEAEGSYRRAILLKHSNADARVNLGQLLQEQGRLEEARECFEQAVRGAPRMLAAHMALGDLALSLGDSKQAVKSYKNALRSSPKHAPAHGALGTALYSLGQIAAAKQSYNRALNLDPRYAAAHFNLGNLYLHEEEYAAAINQYKQALALQPTQSDVYNNLGLAYAALEQNEEAIRSFLLALECNAGYAEAHFNLGNELAKAKLTERAIESLTKAVDLRPGYSKAWQNLGNLQQAREDFAAASDCYRHAIASEPDRPELLNNLGLALAGMEDNAGAAKAFARALALDPSSAETHFNLGNQATALGDHAAALGHFTQATQLEPAYAKAWQNLGASRQALGELSTAVDAWRKALLLAPDDRDILGNLASLLVSQGDPEGVAYLKSIAQADPESPKAHWDLSLALLLQGDYVRGWQEYEWRWAWAQFKFGREPRAFAQPQWRGEPLHDTPILLYAEQGFGDTLQFARYIPLVAQRGGRVILEVQPELYSLLRDIPDAAACVRRGDALPSFAFHCPLMSLPLLFDTTAGTIPPLLSHLLLRQSPGSWVPGGGPLRVGLVWAGNPDHTDDKFRSLTLDQLRPLASVPGVSFVSLQKGTPAAQREDGAWPADLPKALAGITDFADTAAVIAGLDLVITVDTSVAHLAGTLGKPVWMLISHKPEWRWGLGSSTTPWYPSARLFRRGSTEEWSAVIERVAAELCCLASAKEIAAELSAFAPREQSDLLHRS